MAFVLSFFVPHFTFCWCLGKAGLLDYGISRISTYILSFHVILQHGMVHMNCQEIFTIKKVSYPAVFIYALRVNNTNLGSPDSLLPYCFKRRSGHVRKSQVLFADGRSGHVGKSQDLFAGSRGFFSACSILAETVQTRHRLLLRINAL